MWSNGLITGRPIKFSRWSQRSSFPWCKENPPAATGAWWSLSTDTHTAKLGLYAVIFRLLYTAPTLRSWSRTRRRRRRSRTRSTGSRLFQLKRYISPDRPLHFPFHSASRPLLWFQFESCKVPYVTTRPDSGCCIQENSWSFICLYSSHVISSRLSSYIRLLLQDLISHMHACVVILANVYACTTWMFNPGENTVYRPGQ